jgi:proteic killer suppression protein
VSVALTEYEDCNILHPVGVWVDIEFSSNRLANASINYSEATKLFGVLIGRKYIQRISVLRATEKFTQLFGYQALRIHPLKGDRSGQYSITLTANYRLILEKVEEDKVLIIDVEDYHGN